MSLLFAIRYKKKTDIPGTRQSYILTNSFYIKTIKPVGFLQSYLAT